MLIIKNLSKQYGGQKILDSLSFEVPQSQVLVLIGPSGSGKSTVLRCINGLENYQDGTIDLHGLPKSKIGMVFQNFNLFHNMTLLENLTYAPITVLKKNKKEAMETSIKWLKQVGLLEFCNHYPKSLSGGQKQRAAIARTLCMEPEIILFDEPTSALDPENIKSVFDVIKSLSKTGITMIIVTHAMRFASKIADRVLFLDHGVLIEDSSSKSFFQEPLTKRAQDFLKVLIEAS